ncbi:MAG: DinB family protein [Chloroflexi bacterium]|nr:DinB family protein [Chloroflexota bacterium]
MDLGKAIGSQFLAALEMLKNAMAACPGDLWDRPADRNRLWHVAYHALFYVHLYLQKTRESFRPWAKHRKGCERLDHPTADLGLEPYSQADLLEYLELCRQEVKDQLAQLEPDAPSGFHWLPFSKLEAHLYNMRHLQQHTGELMERLGQAGVKVVDWVSQGK